MLSNTHFSMAIHILSVLAYKDGRVTGSEYLADSVGTNPSFLRGLIGRLKDAGLVETQLGKGGGARLARPPSKITLLDVYQATERGPGLKTHKSSDKSVCPVAAGMGRMLSQVNNRIEIVVESELKRVTLAELVETHIEAKI